MMSMKRQLFLLLIFPLWSGVSLADEVSVEALKSMLSIQQQKLNQMEARLNLVSNDDGQWLSMGNVVIDGNRRWLGARTNLKGPRGNKGATGSLGASGAPGVAGARGLTGDKGPRGSVGPAGAAGPQGPVGAQGLKGERCYCGEIP